MDMKGHMLDTSYDLPTFLLSLDMCLALMEAVIASRKSKFKDAAMISPK